VISPASNRLTKRFLGISAARGMAAGPCALVSEAVTAYTRHACEEPSAEIARFESALNASEKELLSLKQSLEKRGANDEAEIFQAHVLFLRDESLQEKTVEAVRAGVNVEAAWMDAVEYFANQLAALPDPVFSARSADVRDVGQRVLRHLLGIDMSPGSVLKQPSVVVARDLAPSQTVGLDRSLLMGFCTAEGGPTSHTAILAKALGLPAIVGLGREILEIESGTMLLVDAGKGELIADPTAELLAEFQTQAAQQSNIAGRELAQSHSVARTRDAVRVEVVANVGSREDALEAIRLGAEGIGLLRTEFLYLNRRESPSEEEQVANYAAIFDIMGQRPIVVRTLDVGGDKEIPYLRLGTEANPFLGWRAIRVCLDRPDFFKRQLRAILRASQGHDVRIMFPMIATLDEVSAAKGLFGEAKAEVLGAGYSIAESFQLGIMVEIPSTVVLADRFARQVDFFSIGTNDLTQYTMAADRGNNHVAHLTDPCHPAVLRQIKRVIEEGHKAGIWVGLCGELGGDPAGIPILLGLGLDEFSIAPSAIPHAKAILREWTMSDARQVAAAVLDLDSADQVRVHVAGASRDAQGSLSR
jgi:phosphoenolpyruvate-protein phosphotransferase